jgi:hypothetical protein
MGQQLQEGADPLPHAPGFIVVGAYNTLGFKLILDTVLRISSSSHCGCESTTSTLSGARRLRPRAELEEEPLRPLRP